MKVGRKSAVKVFDSLDSAQEYVQGRGFKIENYFIKERKAKQSQDKMRKSLLYRLIGEILSGVKYEGYSNADMERGIAQEPDARVMYEFVSDIEVGQIGLVKEGAHKHYSPDGLYEENGLIEIKSVIPSVQVETILSGKVPAAYRKQIQWGLHICQKQWCDFISYSPLVSCQPIFIIQVVRDAKLIKELDEGADKFIKEMLELVEKIKGV
jgi:hypothetical protein